METPATIQQLIENCYAHERAGEISQARQSAQAAVEAARRGCDAETLASALVSLAYVANRLGHFEQSRSLAEEALERTPPLSRARAAALRILGDCAHEAGDLTAAERFYHQAIDLSRQLGLTYLLHRCLHSLSACVYLPRGQFELALAADAESVHLAEQEGLFEEIWLPLLTLSWTYWVIGQRQEALAAADLMRQHVIPHSLGEGYYFSLMADLTQEGADPASAVALYQQARAIAEIVGAPGLNVELRLGLSRYYRDSGSSPTAFYWAEDALKITFRADCRDLQGAALIERGRAAWDLGDLPGAQRDFEAALQLLTPMQASYDLARTQLLLAGLLYQSGDPGAEAAWLAAVTGILKGGYEFLLERERSLALPLLSAHLNSASPLPAEASAALLKRLARVPPPPLQIRTLGGFSVTQERRLIPEGAWQARRAGELFRLLLLSPRHELLREQIIEALWPQSAASAAMDLFHRATSALRRALEPDLPEKFPSRYLEVSRGAVILHLPPGTWVDYQAFLKHIDAENWQAALELYAGDLFPGDVYSDWAVAQRESLRQEALRAALELARRLLKASEYKAALEASRRALALEPWQEEAVLLGMQSCLALNDRIGAIRLYQDLSHRLRDELGIEPEAELQVYYQSLL